jgi:hypothetical protein
MPGEYFLDRPLELDPRDNGLAIEAETAGTATLYGGTLVTGWRRDGERLWYADLPGVKEGAWDFRALVVNGRMPERARLPETGTFLHTSVFDVQNLSSVGGGWERKPTRDELTTMLYDPKDLAPTLEVKNAEVRVYHMWDESLCGVARNDRDRHMLKFSTPAQNPPGAFGIKKYAIYNTREGMTHPGQWYLDRAAGRVVYWPLAGEDMTKAKVVAPRFERLIRIAGNATQPAERIAIRGFAVQATTTPLKSTASVFDGAISIAWAKQCVLEHLEICNVGGQGILAQHVTGCRITDCHIHHTGAFGIKADGSATSIARNHVHHSGVYYPSASGVFADNQGWRNGLEGFHIQRNEVHDTPYCGIVGRGGKHLIEENLIYRAMRELHDGAAIYGAMSQSVLRNNLVRDVVKAGEGYGVSSYYLDENSQDTVIERNVSIGVDHPIHNHIARRCIIRDNVLISEKEMMLSFERSTGGIFQGNTLYAPGGITINQPGAIKVWTNNVIFRNGVDKGGVPQAFVVSDAMPPVAPPARRGVLSVERVLHSPVLDGEMRSDEWPRRLLSLYREPSRWAASGAPAFARLAYDDRCLYVAVNVTMFDSAKLRTGTKWGKDDGAEVCIAGKAAHGKPASFVVHGFAGGACQSVTDAGAPADAAQRLGKVVHFVAKPYNEPYGDKRKCGWHGQWAIPWESLGLKPASGRKLAFNIGVFRSEDGVWRCWEGTLAENWRLDQAGVLRLE